MVKIRSCVDNSGKIVSLCPESILDLFDGNAVGSLREGKTVILNLSELGDAERVRTVDFMTGAAVGLNGEARRIDACSYVFAAE